MPISASDLLANQDLERSFSQKICPTAKRWKFEVHSTPCTHKVNVHSISHDLDINTYLSTGKQVTVQSLQAELQAKQILTVSCTTTRSRLSNISLKYRKDDNRRALLEKANTASMRSRFLRNYMENLSSKFSRQVVFTDETWIFSKGSKMHSWQDDSVKRVRKPEGFDGKRFMILHAGNANGFIQNASLIFTTKSTLADYHGDRV